MENKYFTPSKDDIRIGLECELLAADDKTWVKTTIDHWCPGYQLETLRIPYLTLAQIESCGFTLKAKSIDYWFQINEDKRFDTDVHNFCGYKCYNIFLNYGFHDYRLKIRADFGVSGFEEAEVLYDGECKCINQLKQILKQIHITPFYAG